LLLGGLGQLKLLRGRLDHAGDDLLGHLGLEDRPCGLLDLGSGQGEAMVVGRLRTLVAAEAGVAYRKKRGSRGALALGHAHLDAGHVRLLTGPRAWRTAIVPHEVARASPHPAVALSGALSSPRACKRRQDKCHDTMDGEHVGFVQVFTFNLF